MDDNEKPKGMGKVIQIDEARIRDRLGVPLIVHSAYRSPAYNRQVGGAEHSMHLQGAAFDISMANHDPESFEAAARAIGFTGFGFYPRQNFMHIDIGRERQWGDGRDGPTDAAGGLADNTTTRRMAGNGGNLIELLGNNDSYAALHLAGDLLVTDATGTSVADLQLFLADRV